MNRLAPIGLLCRLSRQEPIDARAVAFILTEMRFRGGLFRTCEIIYALWLIYGRGREPTLTLGKCQVSFRYWRARYGTNNWLLFRAILCDVANYDVCCDYLSANQRDDLKQTIICYNGRPSVLYVRFFLENLELVNATIRTLRAAGHVHATGADQWREDYPRCRGAISDPRKSTPLVAVRQPRSTNAF